MGLLDDKVCLLTGGGSGIGAAVARRFAAEGAALWLNDIDAETLEETVRACRAVGAETEAMVGDVSQSVFIDEWVDAAAERHGRVDVLYNNVGVARFGLVGDTTDEAWHFQTRLNLDSVFFATRAVLRHMVPAGKGSVVSMSSGAGIGGQYNMAGYAAAKAGVINLMQTVATEYGRNGIRANAVTPGPTATAPLLAYLESRPGGVEGHTSDTHLDRLTDPEEVAGLVAWLASDQASSISGIVLQSNTRIASNRPDS